MRKLIFTIALLFAVATTLSAQEIIAHRGFHKASNGAHNSIGALVAAVESGFMVVEFDIVRTVDGERIVAHGPQHGNMRIAESTLEELRTEPLLNGEAIPTLTEYLEVAAQYPDLRLIVEIKGDIHEEESISCAIVKEELERLGLMPRATFISFSKHACDIMTAEGMPTLYLNGDLKPREAKERGYTGINYHFSKYRKKSEWVRKAKREGLAVAVWTVNKEKDAKWAKRKGFDYITSDDPEMIKEILEQPKHQKSKKHNKEQ